VDDSASNITVNLNGGAIIGVGAVNAVAIDAGAVYFNGTDVTGGWDGETNTMPCVAIIAYDVQKGQARNYPPRVVITGGTITSVDNVAAMSVRFGGIPAADLAAYDPATFNHVLTISAGEIYGDVGLDESSLKMTGGSIVGRLGVQSSSAIISVAAVSGESVIGKAHASSSDNSDSLLVGNGVRTTALSGKDYNWSGTEWYLADPNFTGLGTEANPYKISGSGELSKLAELVNSGAELPGGGGRYADAYYELAADIDLADYSELHGSWTPIGFGRDGEGSRANDYYFGGSFDGKGHVISGLTIGNDVFTDNVYNVNLGLFGAIRGAYVTNLTLEDVNINIIETPNESFVYSIGGIAGALANVYNSHLDYDIDPEGVWVYEEYGSITNCAVTGLIHGAGFSYAAGIAGNLSATISGCYSNVDIYGNEAGGIAGYVAGVIENSYALGNVSGGDAYLGGIAGHVRNGSINNCYTTGSVTGGVQSIVGGIAGKVGNNGYDRYGGTVTNCIALNTSVTGGEVARVAGHVVEYDVDTRTFVTGNYSYSGMAINSQEISSLGTTPPEDGDYVTRAEIKAPGFFEGVFGDDDWTYSAGSLPGFGSMVELPSHLAPLTEAPLKTVTSKTFPGVDDWYSDENYDPVYFYFDNIVSSQFTGRLLGQELNVLTYELTAKPGYTFDGIAANFFVAGEWHNYTITNEAGSNIVRIITLPERYDITDEFTDANFLAAVQEVVGSETITLGDVLGVTELDVSGLGITSLAGIEYFADLRDLYCNNNELTTLDVSGLTELYYLNCKNNYLTAEPIVHDNFGGWWEYYPQYPTPSKTLSDTYEIYTAAQLAGLSALQYEYDENGFTQKYTSADYVLMNDIDLSEAYYWPYDGWMPIGSYHAPFTGTFNGGGNVISNLYFNMSSAEGETGGGLFGFVKGGTIINLGLENVDIYLGSGDGTGGVAGRLTGGLIKNCYVTGTVQGAGYAGGIVGLFLGGSVENCYSIATVMDTASTYLNDFNGHGGIVGYIDDGSWSGLDISSSVINCAALNDSVSGPGNLGRVVGYNADDSGTLSGNVAYVGMQLLLDGEPMILDEVAADNIHGLSVDVDYIYANYPKVAEYFNFITDEFDPDFRAAVLDILGKQTGTISRGDVLAVRTLDVSGRELTSLEGIEQFENLEYLDCSWNQLTTLDLSGLAKLEMLYCGANRFTTLNVSELPKLGLLACDYNQLTELNLSELPSLWCIDCSGNELTELDLSGLTNLENLYCSENNFSSLDLSGLPKLYDLHCYFNYLTAEPTLHENFYDYHGYFGYGLQKPMPGAEPGTYEIYTGAQLMGLAYLANSDDAEAVYASANYVLMADVDLSEAVDYSFGGWQPIGTAYVPFSGTFDGDGYVISGLTINTPDYSNLGLFGYVSDGGTVQNLGLAGIKIVGYQHAYVGGIVGQLESGTVDNCYVTGAITGVYDVGGIAGYVGAGGTVTNCAALLESVSGSTIGRVVGRLDGGTLTGNLAYDHMLLNGSTASGGTASNTGGFSIDDDYIRGNYPEVAQYFNFITENFTDPAFRAAVLTELGKPESGRISHGDVLGARWLDVSSRGIASLAGIEQFVNLRELNCSSNVLASLDVSALTKLENLDCSGNGLETFNALGLTNLRGLWCSDNYLTELDVSGLTKLVQLDCSYNYLTELDLSGLTKLRTLDCSYNYLTETPAEPAEHWGWYCEPQYPRDTNFAGFGIASSPFQIGTAEELRLLAELVNSGESLTDGRDDYARAYYELTADIDLAADFALNGTWVPMGDYYSVQGDFDGKGHVISGLTINALESVNAPESGLVGLFGEIYYGTVQNLGLEDVDINVDIIGGIFNVGGIVGDLSPGIIRNCYTTGTIGGCGRVGGIAGLHYGGVIQNTYSTATIFSTIYGDAAGGVVGHATVNPQITGNVALNDSIGGSSTAERKGRVAGYISGNGNPLSNNVGWLGTLVNGERVSGTFGDQNGLSVTLADLTPEVWMGTLGWSSDIWTFEEGKLPGFGAAREAPAHLLGVDWDESETPHIRDITAEFEDPQFRAAVRYELGKADDEAIYFGDVVGVTTLDVNGLDKWDEVPETLIASLAGIEWFTGLEYLDCSYNRLTELDVSGLTMLEHLDCSGNMLRTLNVLGLTNLREMWCGGNKLTELDVSGLTNLVELYCGYNRLTELVAAGLTSLQVLYCSDNYLPELDLSGLSTIENLSCDRNRLTELDVSELTNLSYIDFGNNFITTENLHLPTTLPPDWGNFRAWDDWPDYQYDPDITGWVDPVMLPVLLDVLDKGEDDSILISDAPSIRTLDLSGLGLGGLGEPIRNSGSQISSVISLFYNLETLDLSNNYLGSVEIIGLVNLKTLNCSNNANLFNIIMWITQYPADLVFNVTGHSEDWFAILGAGSYRGTDLILELDPTIWVTGWVEGDILSSAVS
jgi:Leucine-rich repeat (LRR) protein